MPVKASSRTTAKFLFTRKRRSQLSKLLYAEQPQGLHGQALQQMDRLVAKFRNDLQKLGSRPLVEMQEKAGRRKAGTRPGANPRKETPGWMGIRLIAQRLGGRIVSHNPGLAVVEPPDNVGCATCGCTHRGGYQPTFETGSKPPQVFISCQGADDGRS